MRFNKITFSLLLIISPVVMANEAKAPAPLSLNNSSLLADPFFRDTKVDLKLRNHWKYLLDDTMAPKTVQSAWGQGIVLDYRSGYFADFIGFDASYYGALKLAASDDFDGRGILYNNGVGNNKHNATGFSKFGQRYVKLKQNIGDFRFAAKGGMQELRDVGIITTSNHLSPTTYLGWSGDLSYQNATLTGAYVTRGIERNSPHTEKFKAQNGQAINYVMTGAFSYKSEPFSAQYAYGEANDYVQRQHLFLTYQPQQQLSLGSQIYRNKALRDYKAMSASKRTFDNNAWHYAVDAKWQADKWSTKLGIGYTQANKSGDVGVFTRNFAKNFRGTYTSMAKAGVDYMHDGETALSGIVDYKITPTVIGGLMVNYGQFHYRDNHIKRGEVNVYSMWTPDTPALKNLSVFALAGPGWSYKENKNTPILTDGNYHHARFFGAEVLISYKFNLI